MARGPRYFRRERPDGSLGDVWWTNLGGRRVSTGCTDLEAAKRWRTAQERTAADPAFAAAEAQASAARAYSLNDATDELLAELRRRGRSEATIKKNAQKVGPVLRLWGPGLSLSDVDAKLVARYIDQRLTEPGVRAGTTVSRLTIRDELVAIRQVLALARRQGLYTRHPDDVLPPRFETRHRPRRDWVRREDLDRLLEHVEPRHAAHLLFFCTTGGRTADSYRSRRADWNLTRGRETVLVRGSKTVASFRTIPITPFLVPLVRRLLRDAPGADVLFDPWANMIRDLKAACRRAGIPEVSTNGLRRSFGMWHRLEGYSLDVVSKLFGHTTAALVRDVYANVDGEELRAAMAASRGDRYRNGTRTAPTPKKRRQKAA